MAQLPEKIDINTIDPRSPQENLLLAQKLNEIIDYLGELEGGGKA